MTNRKRNSRSADTPGLLVVDKPAGPTSHDIVDRVRRAMHVRRVGHTGTLDPFATGVLPVCVGKATRLARFLSQSDKSYEAVFRFGFATTTDDCKGEPLAEPRPVLLTQEQVEAACAPLRGEQTQVPPLFSAKKIGGRRSHELARNGKEVARRGVRVVVHELEVLGVEADRARMRIVCSAGTYVRALARDLGQALGVGGHVSELRRLRAAGFGLDRAIPGDQLTSEAASLALIPLAEMLSELPALRVGPEGYRAVGHGRVLVRELVLSGFVEQDPPNRVRVLDEAGSLLALAVPKGFGTAVPGLPVEPGYHPDVVLIAD